MKKTLPLNRYLTQLPSLLICAVLVFAGLKTSAQFCYNQSITITDTIIPPCNHDGQIMVVVTGGVAPFTFNWHFNNAGVTIATTQNLSGVMGGSYTLVVTDFTGACNTFYFWVPTPFNINYSTTPDHCPNHDGSATVNASGGSIPYYYQWSNGSNTQTITNLIGGIYDCTITDAAGCQVVVSESDSLGGLQVYMVDSIQVLTSSVDANCTNTGGSVTVTSVTGGLPPYTYLWNNTWTTQTVNNLSGYTYYNVMVTDANGCAGYAYALVNFVTPITLAFTSTQENCNHQDGTATVVPNGSIGPYTYLWGNGETTQTITALSGGTYYYVTVHDGSGCINNAYTYVSSYSPIQPNLNSVNEVCHNGGGFVTANPTLDTAPYTYTWNNGATTQSLSNISAGSYIVTINDNAGCSVAASVYIQDVSPITPNLTHTDEVCAVSLGSASASPTGGAAPYTYQWNSGQTTASLSGLSSAVYYVTITDNNGCTVSAYAIVNLNSGVNGSAWSSANEVCLMHNGAATCSFTGGAPPYVYTWSTGASTQSITNVSSGYYTVSVHDQNGCSVVKYAQVYRNSPMSATVTVNPATCIFNNDGSATVATSGGTAPYTYQWGNGSTSASASNLNAEWGIGVVVNDVNGCVAEAYRNSVGYQNLTCAAIIEGKVIDDQNADCLFNGSDAGLHNTYVSCVPGYSRLTNTTGDYQFIVPANNYAVTQYAAYRNQACPVGSIVLNGCVAGTTYGNNDFFDQPLNVNDLRVSFGDVTPPRPGFDHTITVCYYNDGLHDVSGQVDFVYDAGATYISGGTSVNVGTHTVTILFSNLGASDGYNCVDLVFNTPSGTALGTIQTYTATITPNTLDATPYNNTATANYTVVGAYDPNTKEVSPKGTGPQGFILAADTVLKYTIHFQNTGNFDASFVVIRDSLDSNLDFSSILPGASNHTYRMEMQGQNVLVFLFDPINLPDSTSDFAASNGFVSFYIKLKRGLADGTQIHNKAGIYFDFNVPVTTNTTLNTLKTTTGIQEMTDGIGMNIMPNPSAGKTDLLLQLKDNFKGDLSITDLLGKNLFSETLNLESGSQIVPLNFENVVSGIYIVQLKNSETSVSRRFVKQ